MISSEKSRRQSIIYNFIHNLRSSRRKRDEDPSAFSIMRIVLRLLFFSKYLCDRDVIAVKKLVKKNFFAIMQTETKCKKVHFGCNLVEIWMLVLILRDSIVDDV